MRHAATNTMERGILKRWPFYLMLLPVFFCLHGSVENFGSLLAEEVAEMGLSILLVIGVVLLAWYLLNRKFLFNALVVFFVSVWFFFFGALQDGLRSSAIFHPIAKFSVLPFLLCVATVLVYLVLKKKTVLLPKLTFYLNILLVLYCIVDGVKLILLSSNYKSPLQAVQFNNDAVQQKPNVYFLLFDSYPANAYIRDSLHFDNRGFDSTLSSLNFVKLPVSANYDNTSYSMASILNMRYVTKNFKVDVGSRQEEQYMETLIKNGAVFSIFEKMQYRVIPFSIFDVGKTAGLEQGNAFLLGHNALLLDKIFINRLLKEVWIPIPAFVTKIFPFIRHKDLYQHRDNNLAAISKLKALDPKKLAQPVFCYTHLIMPHRPFFYDANGRDVPSQLIDVRDGEQFRNTLKGYLIYTNKIALELVHGILLKDPGAYIILMSDHGERLHLGSENFKNMAHIRFGNKLPQNMPDTLTNVNIFPFFFNEVFRQNFHFLQDTAIKGF